MNSLSLSPLLFLLRNTLLCSLQFFESFFARLLSLNTLAFSTGSSPSPVTLVIPYTVLQELDGLKNSRRDVSSDAREANRWILAALQAQKKVFVKMDLGDGLGKRHLPLEESRWAMHVQNRRNMQEVLKTSGNCTVSVFLMSIRNDDIDFQDKGN